MSIMIKTRERNNNAAKAIVGFIFKPYNDQIDKIYEDEIEILEKQKNDYETLARISNGIDHICYNKAHLELSKINARLDEIKNEKMNNKITL